MARIAYADEPTDAEGIALAAQFAAVKKHFDARRLTELTATIAACNLVSRFIEAMQIDPERH